jgi:hypothetical protein
MTFLPVRVVMHDLGGRLGAVHGTRQPRDGYSSR